MKKIIYYLFPILFFASCDNKNLDVDTSSIKDEVKIKRYELALFEQNIEHIESSMGKLSSEFPLFVSPNYAPAELQGLVEYILNPSNQKLYIKSVEVFKDFKPVEKELIDGFKHFKYHFPEQDLPSVYTYISGLNYMEPIICNDTAVVLGIDMFLGQHYEEYRREKIPLYISKEYDQKYIPTEVMRNYGLSLFASFLDGETLLDCMISLGKIEYFVKAMYPQKQDSIQFAFTPVQMEWCDEREKALWQHLAAKKLLFSKDYQVFKKYIEDQPFISSMERESPGRAGVWIGYKIVSRYMNNHSDVSLYDLMTTTDQNKIFQGSKYKP